MRVTATNAESNSNSNTNTVREVARPPDVMRLYGRAVLTARARRGHVIPGVELVRSNVRVDRGNLARYSRVCGFATNDAARNDAMRATAGAGLEAGLGAGLGADLLPVTYPHLLAFPLAVQLMTEPGFPIGLVGLVHVANRIAQYRPLLATESLTVRVRATDLRPHARGRQFDVVTDVVAAGESVWTESSTYLSRRRSGAAEVGASRNGATAPTRVGAREPRDSAKAAELPEPTAVWHVATDVGRRYGAVSGDRNPIHLNPLTARLFGYPRAIAHGMWVKAAALAAVDEQLPAAFTVDARFKLPMLLPATAALSAVPTADTDTDTDTDKSSNGRGGGLDVEVHDVDTAKPHLAATVRPI